MDNAWKILAEVSVDGVMSGVHSNEVACCIGDCLAWLSFQMDREKPTAALPTSSRK